MKKLFLLLFAIALTCSASPVKEMDTNTEMVCSLQSKLTIIGRWQTKVPGKVIYMYYDFNQNGTGRLSNSVNDEYYNFRWSLNGRTLYLVQTNGDDDEVYEFEILSFDNNNMVIHPKGVAEDKKLFFSRK